MAGVILSVRPLMRMGFAEWLASSKIIDGGSFDPTPEEIEEDKQTTLDAKSSRIGFYMALVGTLIWAYGDLIGGLPDAQPCNVPDLVHKAAQGPAILNR